MLARSLSSNPPEATEAKLCQAILVLTGHAPHIFVYARYRRERCSPSRILIYAGSP